MLPADYVHLPDQGGEVYRAAVRVLYPRVKGLGQKWDELDDMSLISMEMKMSHENQGPECGRGSHQAEVLALERRVIRGDLAGVHLVRAQHAAIELLLILSRNPIENLQTRPHPKVLDVDPSVGLIPWPRRRMARVQLSEDKIEHAALAVALH